MRTKIDAIDKKIIERLQEDGRASFSAIAREVKVSDVAIKKRFESLKRRGIIEAVRAKINLKALGYENPIFVQIRTEISKNKDLIAKLSSFDNVRELYQVLGEYN
ncbi:MAG: AsnC family transcriptional regulator, partial [Candidatus Diapherotrites archaeon]|nr:AsnC family transcriptional regulator [Candidatus Diapherotrites archaeon]